MIQMPENERGMMRYWVKMRRTLDQEYSVRILGDVYDVNFLELAMWNMAFRAEQVGVVLVERAEVEEILGIRSSVVDVV